MLLGIAALSLGAEASASASPEDVFGFGARSSALAGTGTASAEGYEAVYANPALLPYTRDTKLTLGFQGAIFDLRAGGEIPTDHLAGSIIGAALPIPIPGVLKNRITLGVGFFTPFNLVVRGRILYPEVKQFILGDRTESVAVQAALGVDLSWWNGRERQSGLHIGGGFAALAALRGNVLVGVDGTGKIGSVVQDTLVGSYAPVVGASMDVSRDFRIGAAFRGELVGRFNVEILVKDLGSITVPPLEISGVAQYDPWEISAEFAKVSGPFRAALSLTYKHWSAYPGPPEATVRCPVDPMTGAVQPCDALVPPAPNFHDTAVPRVSAEYTFAARSGVDMRFRGGYAFEPTPAPAQTKEPNLFDEHRSIVSIGYGLDLKKPVVAGLSLDSFAQLQILHGRDHKKDAAVPATNPGAPDTKTSGVVVAGGTTLGVGF